MINKKKNKKVSLKKPLTLIKKNKKITLKKPKKILVKVKKTIKPKKAILKIKKAKGKVKKNTIVKNKKIAKIKIVKKAFSKKPTAIKAKKLAVVKKVIKKVVIHKAKPTFLAESFFKAKIKVIGIGGGGSSIVSEISRSLNKATFVIADTDARNFGKQKGVKYFLFGQEQTHGLGTGLNVELARESAEKEKEKIAGLFENQDIVIFIASLGGGVGSGATKVFTEISKSFGGISFGIFTLPFKFEGAQKYKIANKALSELKKSLNVSITIPNERIFKVIDLNTPIVDAFSTVNKRLIEGLESLIDLIYIPGVINIDFADVKAILSGRGNEAFLNTAEASGKDRAEKIVKEILHNHLYQNNNFTPEKVLFNILGGDNLSMFEVDKISKAISQTNPKAKIIFGISKNTKYKNKIKATLLMTGGGVTREKEPEKEKIKNVAPTVKKIIVKKALIQKKKEKLEPIEVLPKSDKIISKDTILPAFSDASLNSALQKLDITEIAQKPKKTIRRNALEIKKSQEIEENKKTMQEEEWEIPAFLRLKK